MTSPFHIYPDGVVLVDRYRITAAAAGSPILRTQVIHCLACACDVGSGPPGEDTRLAIAHDELAHAADRRLFSNAKESR